MKTLFCILGRSACGKDSLVNALCNNTDAKKVISYTTRAKRIGETNTHIFSTKDVFDKHQEEKSTVASTQIGDVYYWTTIDQVLSCDFYIIDPNGLKELKEKLTNLPIKIVSIYITAPDREREKRNFLRDSSSQEAYMKRIAAEEQQFYIYEKEKTYDYCIHNVHYGGSLEQLQQIVAYEKEKNNAL